MKDGYSICFNDWALDKEIKSELGLLLIISSLTAERGYCFASNNYFSELFKIDEVSVSRKIKKLEQKKYISIEYEKRGAEVVSRKIRLTKMLTDDIQKSQSTINKNVKDNNTSINITSINKEKIYKKEKLEDVDESLPQDKPAPISKHKYGKNKNVLLTEDESKKLLDMDKGQKAIDYLSDYMLRKVYKTQSHYLAILKWVFKAMEEEEIKAKELELRKQRLQSLSTPSQKRVGRTYDPGELNALFDDIQAVDL